MIIKRSFLAAIILPFTCFSTPALAVSQGEAAARILRLHNQERELVGIAPLRWNEALAASAAAYGPELADLGRLVHSPKASRPGQRENLARIQSSYSSPDRLVGSWLSEKSNFEPGVFPNVSRTGNWYDVAHYSQMVWSDTTDIGCAIHRGGGWDYLICRYSRPGNIDGKRVY